MTDLWAGVVGQPSAVSRLTAAVKSPVHAYLFVGPAGVGKRAAARAFAAALLCDDAGCGQCRACRLALAGEHPDVRIVERVGAAISAEQADEIVRVSALAPMEGRRKILILDEFHLLRPEGAARLLKTIEEPPASTIFVVIANDVPPELVTIASRCVRIEFSTVPHEAIVSALVADGASLETAQAAATAAGGNLERARILANDPAVTARHEAFAGAPRRLDGSGAAVARIVDEVLGLLDGAAAPLQARQDIEAVALAAQIETYGERGSGRKALEERHKREVRRYRTDELRSGLVAIAGTYRDHLVGARAVEHEPLIAAVHDIHGCLESLERNPNETLMLQALLLRLPGL